MIQCNKEMECEPALLRIRLQERWLLITSVTSVTEVFCIFALKCDGFVKTLDFSEEVCFTFIRRLKDV
jgi:hypothetical protein